MIDFSEAPEQSTLKEDPFPETKQPIQAFADVLAEHGLNPPGGINPDGELHKFDSSKKGDKAAWYVFFYGDICGAAYGDFKEGIDDTWCSVLESTMTYPEREKYQEKIKAAKEKNRIEKQKNQAETKIKAQALWSKSTTVIGKGHKYLEAKGVDSHYLRVGKNKTLYVPMFDKDMDMWNLERIVETPGAKKKGLTGGKRKGLFFPFMGSNPITPHDKIFIGEGYSTCATIHEVTRSPVYCSFNAGNMPPVAEVIRTLYPTNHIVICADDDRWKKVNIGIKKAKQAAQIIGASVVWPTFQDSEEKPTDFNDLYRLEGRTMVLEQLTGRDRSDESPPISDLNTALVNWLVKKPPPMEYILYLDGKPLMPKGVVGALSATGGVGKTFFLMSLAAAMAAGKSFGPITAPRGLKVLCIFGEDDQDEVGRRFWEICKGKFPKNLHAASVYGDVGPLMKMDGKNAVKAPGFYWLDNTLRAHPGLDMLIFDPKSRFYGLEENSNDHGNAWISCLETLRMRHDTNILFSTHTSDANANKLSQTMNRGASSIVDGCRWGAGMIVMDKGTADRYAIPDPYNYVIFDAPKSNYTAMQAAPIYFKRGPGGILEHTILKNDRMADFATELYRLLDEDGGLYSIRELDKEDCCKHIIQVLKTNCPSFERKEIKTVWEHMVEKGMAKVVNAGSGRTEKFVLEIVEKQAGIN